MNDDELETKDPDELFVQVDDVIQNSQTTDEVKDDG